MTAHYYISQTLSPTTNMQLSFAFTALLASASAANVSPQPRGLQHLRMLGTGRECPSDCGSSHGGAVLGRQCCKQHGITDKKCHLNGPSDTCKCYTSVSHSTGLLDCYIDMRCDDAQTWQNGECRVKPGNSCGLLDAVPCTDGYTCLGKYHHDKLLFGTSFCFKD